MGREAGKDPENHRKRVRKLIDENEELVGIAQ